MGRWTDIFVGDEKKRRETRKKRIKKLKDKNTPDPKEDYIKKKKLGHKAVKTQRKKKRMLEEAGK